MAEHGMRSFWDRRADENAYFFVDNRLDYRDPDLDAFWERGEKDLGTLLDHLGVEVAPDDVVVEIGCGVGRLTRGIAARAKEVVALDVSERMLELAREHNPELTNVRWVLGDGETLTGVPDASADAVFSHVVFQHIPDPAVTLGYVREMGRVLRPGGWAGFQVSNAPNVHRRRAGVKKRALALVGKAPAWEDRREWLGSAVDLDGLRRVAAESGLEVPRVQGERTQFCLVLLRKP